MALDREKRFYWILRFFKKIYGSSSPATSRTPMSAPDAAKEGDTWLDWLFTQITMAWSWGVPCCFWSPIRCSGFCWTKWNRQFVSIIMWAACNQLCWGLALSHNQLTMYNAFYELLFSKCCYVYPFFIKVTLSLRQLVLWAMPGNLS